MGHMQDSLYFLHANDICVYFKKQKYDTLNEYINLCMLLKYTKIIIKGSQRHNQQKERGRERKQKQQNFKS